MIEEEEEPQAGVESYLLALNELHRHEDQSRYRKSNSFLNSISPFDVQRWGNFLYDDDDDDDCNAEGGQPSFKKHLSVELEKVAGKLKGPFHFWAALEQTPTNPDNVHLHLAILEFKNLSAHVHDGKIYRQAKFLFDLCTKPVSDVKLRVRAHDSIEKAIRYICKGSKRGDVPHQIITNHAGWSNDYIRELHYQYYKIKEEKKKNKKKLVGGGLVMDDSSLASTSSIQDTMHIQEEDADHFAFKPLNNNNHHNMVVPIQNSHHNNNNDDYNFFLQAALQDVHVNNNFEVTQTTTAASRTTKKKKERFSADKTTLAALPKVNQLFELLDDHPGITTLDQLDQIIFRNPVYKHLGQVYCTNKTAVLRWLEGNKKRLQEAQKRIDAASGKTGLYLEDESVQKLLPEYFKLFVNHEELMSQWVQKIFPEDGRLADRGDGVFQFVERRGINLWIYGASKIGKSMLLHILTRCFNCLKPPQNDTYWDNFNPAIIYRFMLIDEFDGTLSDKGPAHSANLLKIYGDNKSGYMIKQKFDKGTFYVKHHPVIITSNYSIEEIYKNRPKQDIEALKTRFVEINLDIEVPPPMMSDLGNADDEEEEHQDNNNNNDDIDNDTIIITTIHKKKKDCRKKKKTLLIPGGVDGQMKLMEGGDSKKKKKPSCWMFEGEEQRLLFWEVQYNSGSFSSKDFFTKSSDWNTKPLPGTTGGTTGSTSHYGGGGGVYDFTIDNGRMASIMDDDEINELVDQQEEALILMGKRMSRYADDGTTMMMMEEEEQKGEEIIIKQHDNFFTNYLRDADEIQRDIGCQFVTARLLRVFCFYIGCDGDDDNFSKSTAAMSPDQLKEWFAENLGSRHYLDCNVPEGLVDDFLFGVNELITLYEKEMGQCG